MRKPCPVCAIIMHYAYRCTFMDTVERDSKKMHITALSGIFGAVFMLSSQGNLLHKRCAPGVSSLHGHCLDRSAELSHAFAFHKKY